MARSTEPFMGSLLTIISRLKAGQKQGVNASTVRDLLQPVGSGGSMWDTICLLFQPAALAWPKWVKPQAELQVKLARLL